jgi:hypothetical protein
MAKKLINQPAAVVRESLEGAVLTQPGTALLGDRLIVVRVDRVVSAANLLICRSRWSRAAEPGTSRRTPVTSPQAC